MSGENIQQRIKAFIDDNMCRTDTFLAVPAISKKLEQGMKKDIKEKEKTTNVGLVKPPEETLSEGRQRRNTGK
jgi:predicted transcriptional regulator